MATNPPSAKSRPKASNAATRADSAANHLGCRLKELRDERGWSLDVLASASGVTRSMLSQVDRNRANPTLAVASRIASAFGMSLAELVQSPGAMSSLIVIRASDHAYDYRSDQDCRIRTLSPLHLEKDVEFYQVQLREGGALRSAAHFEGTREFLAVQKGRVRVESGGDSEDLDRGDSVNYRADVQHAIVNIGKGDAVVFLVDIYR